MKKGEQDNRSKADRFVDEFNDDYVEALGIPENEASRPKTTRRLWRSGVGAAATASRSKKPPRPRRRACAGV